MSGDGEGFTPEAIRGFGDACEALGVVLAGRDVGCEGFSDWGVELPEDSAGLEDEPSFASRRRRIYGLDKRPQGQLTAPKATSTMRFSFFALSWEKGHGNWTHFFHGLSVGRLGKVVLRCPSWWRGRRGVAICGIHDCVYDVAHNPICR